MTDTKPPAVDWSKPIEAMHDDGRVLPVSIGYLGQSFANVEPPVGPWLRTFDLKTGRAEMSKVWRIRNVQAPAKPATGDTIDPALVARMVALVREIVDGDGAFFSAPYTATARSIVFDLPDEDDPDLIEARRMASEMFPTVATTNFIDGKADGGSAVQLLTAGIRRGREIERMKGEGK